MTVVEQNREQFCKLAEYIPMNSNLPVVVQKQISGNSGSDFGSEKRDYV